jgi:predicted secreted protein
LITRVSIYNRRRKRFCRVLTLSRDLLDAGLIHQAHMMIRRNAASREPRSDRGVRRRWMAAAPIAALLAVQLAVHPATAGDGSALNVLGFSPDGRYFAFEQYGERDGSGVLFSTITAIEVSGDRVVKGTPVTSSLDPEETNRNKEPRDKLIAEVRAKAAADAAAVLKQINISQPGRVIAWVSKSRPREILDSEPVKTVRAAVSTSVALPRDRFGRGAQLVLKEFDIALPRCKDLVLEGHPNGFGLELERKGRPTIHLSRDQTVPAARGCPDRYGLAEVHALNLPDGAMALAVLIQYFYQAFEGPDRRFLAVTGRIK